MKKTETVDHSSLSKSQASAPPPRFVEARKSIPPIEKNKSMLFNYLHYCVKGKKYTLFERALDTDEGKSLIAGHDDLLMQTINWGDLHAVKITIGRGADINFDDGTGWTPLMYAIYRFYLFSYGDYVIIMYLFSIGAKLRDNCPRFCNMIGDSYWTAPLVVRVKVLEALCAKGDIFPVDLIRVLDAFLFQKQI